MNLHSGIDQNDVSQRHSRLQRRWSISTRLLMTVNGVCIILLLVFILHDHRQETKRRLSDKRIALTEESSILLVGVRDLQPHGVDVIQGFLDRACARMEETHSPGHHIVLRFGDLVMQAKSHHRASDDLVATLETAARSPGNQGSLAGRELIVGMAADSNLTVFVSETVDNIRSQVLRDTGRRLGGLIGMAMVAGVIVNIVLFRVVVRPVARLTRIVENIGRGDFAQHHNGFRSRELSFLSHAINRMSDSLARSEKQRQSQLDKARRIQRNLLPRTDAISGVQVAVHYEPADDVAGDFYDIRKLTDGSWAVLFADVTGHGIPAAMNATLLKSHFAEACEQSADAMSIVRHVNRRFSDLTLVEDFATAIVLRFDSGTNTMEAVNTGHDAALLLRDDGTLSEIGSSGLFMGFDPDADWVSESLSVSAGDRLLLYTDGITETADSRQEMFGRNRVVSLFRQTSDQSPKEFLTSLVDACSRHRDDGPQVDDVTALLIQF